MKATVNGVTYEGTEEEISRIVESPPKSAGSCTGGATEAIADIRKEAEARFRELLEKHVDGLGRIQAMQQFNRVFDRIEAAWERESKAIATENAVLPAVCITKASGDAAKLREAILAIKDINDTRPHDAKGYEINDVIGAALAKPARNCDRFGSCAEARAEWWKFEVLPRVEGVVSGTEQSFEEWLFAHAKEWKGDSNGSK